MIHKRIVILLIALLPLQGVFAQSSFSFSPEAIEDRLRTDVYTLASDEMEGRESGTPGEEKAARYIKSRFQEAGLSPLFGDSFIQTFEFSGRLELGEDNFLVIGEDGFTVEEDFFVLSNSESTRVYSQAVYVGHGMQTDMHNDYYGLEGLEDKIFFMEFYLPEDLDERGTPLPMDMLANKIETAIEKGAAAIVFVNTQSWRNDPPLRLGRARETAGIPIMFAQDEVLEFWQQHAQDEYVFLSADLRSETYTSMNVAGYWNNNAEQTVVIGGHFDHLGYGSSGSRSPGSGEIHPGADDNASGTAGVMEAARYLIRSDLSSNNYIFIAFGAEEKGLLGSRHFTNSDAYDMERINYMLNFDMIGRLEDGNFTLYGTGTSPLWESTIDNNTPDGFNIRKSASGMGGSDHTSFYLKDIPVLFFFTGIHNDYHRPTDTPDKINYQGMREIISFSYDMIAELDQKDRLAFSTTPVERRGQQQRRGTGATLGVMPDHAWEGEGVKIMGIVDNRPAQRAGLMQGDVIVSINEESVPDIQEYMRIMNTLQSGQKVMINLMRGDDVVEMEVEL
jgi:aminopeptidase YwaD